MAGFLFFFVPTLSHSVRGLLGELSFCQCLQMLQVVTDPSPVPEVIWQRPFPDGIGFGQNTEEQFQNLLMWNFKLKSLNRFNLLWQKKEKLVLFGFFSAIHSLYL